MNSENYEIIRKAIENKQQIQAIYDGYLRLMCPHVLGHKNYNGQRKEQALFCQFGGESKTDGIITPDNRCWRCVSIEELNDMKVLDGEWYTLETLNKRRTSCVDDIDVEVDL